MGLTTFNRARRLEAERIAAASDDSDSTPPSGRTKGAKSEAPKRPRRKTSGEKSSG